MKHKSSQSNPGFGRHLVIWLLLVAIVVGIGWWLWPMPPTPTPLATTAPAAPGASADYSPLIGRWTRTDGGYVIEILSAAPDGKLEAKYYNPGPINVGQAKATMESGKLTAVVELRDVNYPGSTYRLRHEGAKLAGDYFQATQGETFQVEFTRAQ